MLRAIKAALPYLYGGWIPWPKRHCGSIGWVKSGSLRRRIYAGVDPVTKKADWRYGVAHSIHRARQAGHVIVIPGWSDCSIVQYRTHWRRSSPGMRHWLLNAHVEPPAWWLGGKCPTW